MIKVYAFLANGSEETECLAVADVLIRAGADVTLVSVEETDAVVSSHGIAIRTDGTFDAFDYADADALFLPGGMPGTKRLGAHAPLCGLLTRAAADGRRIAAICAAPSVLGALGLLRGKRATCYPGFEQMLDGATVVKDGVTTDGNVTTARGLGYALDLGLELAALLFGKAKAAEIKASIQYDG